MHVPRSEPSCLHQLNWPTAILRICKRYRACGTFCKHLCCLFSVAASVRLSPLGILRTGGHIPTDERFVLPKDGVARGVSLPRLLLC